eukprot:974631-Pyramimonas_sp.AAC.1
MSSGAARFPRTSMRCGPRLARLSRPPGQSGRRSTPGAMAASLATVDATGNWAPDSRVEAPDGLGQARDIPVGAGLAADASGGA